MEPDKLIPFGPPFYPANVDPGSWAPKSYFKSSKFSESILTHGRWSNTTLDEATNLREREHRLKERTMRQMSRMSDKFRWEVQEVDRIQKQVRARQHRIAEANLCACCAIMIQASWRTHQAKRVARERRGRILGLKLVSWWRRFKIRRNMAIIKRFVMAAAYRRRRRAQRRLSASLKIQRSWRQTTLRMVLGRGVLATAATEIVIEDILVELARRVFIEIKSTVIARAWKKSKSRMIANKGRKGRSGRVFLTQGGASSPRRKPGRAGGSPRSGMASDPSSSYTSRRPPSVRGTNKRSASVAMGVTVPAIINVVNAVTSSAAATTAAEGERRGSSQSGDPQPPSSRGNRLSKDETSGSRSRHQKSGSSATSETEGENGGGGGREHPKPAERSTSSAARSPDEVEDVVEDMAVEQATVPQPRRPSSAKPSRTSEGRSSRTHKFTQGTDSGSHRRCSPTTPGNSQDSVGQSDPRSSIVDGCLDGVGPRGDGFGDDDDLGLGDKVSSLVGGRELGEAKVSKEDYASDTFESLGESLTQ